MSSLMSSFKVNTANAGTRTSVWFDDGTLMVESSVPTDRLEEFIALARQGEIIWYEPETFPEWVYVPPKDRTCTCGSGVNWDECGVSPHCG